MQSVPNFIISSEKLKSIREQIGADGNFLSEVDEKEYSLDISGTGRYESFYEKETNHWLESFDKIEISIKLYKDGDSIDFSDEFEKDIFDQINSISK